MNWMYLVRLLGAGAVGGTVASQGTANLGASDVVSGITGTVGVFLATFTWDYLEFLGEQGKGPLARLKKNKPAG